MNKKTYDIGLLVGTSWVAAGSILTWGVPTALLVTGGLVIGLTLFGAVFMRAKA